jgi:hypothetical protein
VRSLLALVTAPLALCLLLGATVRPALADEPVRPTRVDTGAYPPPETRWKLALVGLGVTSAWYGAAVGFSYAWPDAPGADDLRIPVAGPWMALADTGCADDDPGCSTFTVVLRAILTTMDAVGQAGGVLVAAEALFMPTQEQAGAPRRRPLPRLESRSGVRVRPTPFTAGRDGVGLGVVGSF